MALIDGKQVRSDSLGIVKLKNDAGQGTVLFATGTMLGVTDAPTSDTDIVNKLYADSLASGLDPKESARFTTSADMSGTYNASGGAGTTGSFTNVDLQASSGVFDLTGATVTPAIGDRVLVKDQSDAKQNGIYVVLTLSATGTMERATDHDGSPSNEVSGGNFVFVETGTTYGGTGWVLTGDGILVLNVDNLVWVQFSDASALTGGAGISISSSVASVDLNDNTLEFDTGGNSGQLRVNLATAGADEIGIEGSAGLVLKRSAITDAIIVQNGLNEATDGNGDITIKLGGALTQNTTVDGANGLYNLTMNDLATATITASTVAISTSSGYALNMNGTATFTDAGNSKGMEYAADYSGAFTARSLVDKAYVDSVSEATTASNGLTESGDDIQLGGTLTSNTTVSGDTGTYSLTLNDFSTATLGVNSGASFVMNSTNNTFSDGTSNSSGIIYGADYGATFVDRSLVDKGYVDAAVGAIGDLTTASNGLTETGNDIRLGGALTEDTTVNGDSGTYNFTVSNMEVLTLGDFGGHTFALNGTNAVFTDASVTKTGLEYGADYSASFVNRSLVDKEYVDDAIGTIGDLTTASNGLTEVGNDIQLGGALTANVVVDGANGLYNLTMNDLATATIAASTIAISTSSGYSLDMNGSATFTDTGSSKGIVYAADYSGAFTNRSLVDKEYVDNNSAVGTTSDKDQTASVTSSDFDTTGTAIAATPNNDCYVEVSVNGQQQVLGDGVKTKDCYFSVDGGSNGRAIADIVSGDTLYWVGSVAGFELTGTDSIDFNYQA